MNQIVANDWIKVYGKNDELLAAGKIFRTKDSEGVTNIKKNKVEFKGFSFENKFFFNEKSLNKTLFIKSNEEHLEKEFNLEHIPSYISINYYHDCLEDSNKIDSDILRDFDVDELDEEVCYIVKVLNQFDGIETTGSCCGHGDYPLYVDVVFTEMKPLGILLWIINRPKYDKVIQLTSCPDLKNNNINTCMLRLKTTVIGEEAYKIANEFARDLEVIGRN
jgi:hypothetical protein